MASDEVRFGHQWSRSRVMPANREVVRAVIRAELNLVGLAMRVERKVIDKIVDGL